MAFYDSSPRFAKINKKHLLLFQDITYPKIIIIYKIMMDTIPSFSGNIFIAHNNNNFE